MAAEAEAAREARAKVSNVLTHGMESKVILHMSKNVASKKRGKQLFFLVLLQWGHAKLSFFFFFKYLKYFYMVRKNCETNFVDFYRISLTCGKVTKLKLCFLIGEKAILWENMFQLLRHDNLPNSTVQLKELFKNIYEFNFLCSLECRWLPPRVNRKRVEPSARPQTS